MWGILSSIPSPAKIENIFLLLWIEFFKHFLVERVRLSYVLLRLKFAIVCLVGRYLLLFSRVCVPIYILMKMLSFSSSTLPPTTGVSPISHFYFRYSSGSVVISYHDVCIFRFYWWWCIPFQVSFGYFYIIFSKPGIHISIKVNLKIK